MLTVMKHTDTTISNQKGSEPTVSTDLTPHNELLDPRLTTGGDHGKAEMLTNSPGQSGGVHFTAIMTPVSADMHCSNGLYMYNFLVLLRIYLECGYNYYVL